MKKYITLFAFACFFFVGLQTTTAQNPTQDTPEIRAKLKTIALDKVVELNRTQTQQVYDIYLAYEKNEGVSETDAIQKVLKSIRKVLGAEQVEKFEQRYSKEITRQEKLKSHRG